MKKLFALVLWALFLPTICYAQGPTQICFTSNGKNCIPVSATNPFPVLASASITGFTALTTGTPISVTTGGVSGTLPVGAVVVATNVGATNGAYCALGASATTSSQYLSPGGGWFAFTVGASTQLTCITSTSTTTVNMTGGSGLPTGTGGGGGGGSLSGTTSNASSAVATSSTNLATVGYLYGFNGTTWDQVQVDASKNVKVVATGLAIGSTTAGSTGSLVFCATTTTITGGTTAQNNPLNCTPAGALRNDLSTVVGTTLGTPSNFGTSPGAVVALSANSSLFYGTTAAVGDPCQQNTPTIKPISITTNTTTNIVTGTAAKKIYVCYLYLQTAAANNVAVISGTTGATCGSNTAALVGGTTATNGLNNAANSGQAFSAGGLSVMQVLTNNDDICIITSASTPLAGVIKYVVQ